MFFLRSLVEVAIVSDMFCDDTDCKVLTLIACRKRAVTTQDSNADVCWGDCVITMFYFSQTRILVSDWGLSADLIQKIIAQVDSYQYDLDHPRCNHLTRTTSQAEYIGSVQAAQHPALVEQQTEIKQAFQFQVSGFPLQKPDRWAFFSPLLPHSTRIFSNSICVSTYQKLFRHHIDFNTEPQLCD